MLWSSGQPVAGPPEFSSETNLVLILPTHSRNEWLRQPCPDPGIEPGTCGVAAQEPTSLQLEKLCYENFRSVEGFTKMFA